MSTFEVVLAGDETPHVVTADAYEQEGPMTTFFSCESTHVRLDSWAIRLASFRSVDVRMIRRIEPGAHPQGFEVDTPSLGLVVAAPA